MRGRCGGCRRRRSKDLAGSRGERKRARPFLEPHRA